MFTDTRCMCVSVLPHFERSNVQNKKKDNRFLANCCVMRVSRGWYVEHQACFSLVRECSFSGQHVASRKDNKKKGAGYADKSGFNYHLKDHYFSEVTKIDSL